MGFLWSQSSLKSTLPTDCRLKPTRQSAYVQQNGELHQWVIKARFVRYAACVALKTPGGGLRQRENVADQENKAYERPSSRQFAVENMIVIRSSNESNSENCTKHLENGLQKTRFKEAVHDDDENTLTPKKSKQT